jgi:serine/threonine protein kinase
MGEVYLARDSRLDRQVAIKLLPAETAADPRARERLRREAMAVAAIDHPYICKIFEISEHGEALCLVMLSVDVSSFFGNESHPLLHPFDGVLRQLTLRRGSASGPSSLNQYRHCFSRRREVTKII